MSLLAPGYLCNVNLYTYVPWEPYDKMMNGHLLYKFDPETVILMATFQKYIVLISRGDFQVLLLYILTDGFDDITEQDAIADVRL